jgi:AmiR/NasT family two-component response regulator
MREAMTSRAAIEQAKGVLVAREGCTPEEAFGLLVGESRRRNRKLALIAADLIAEAQVRSGRSVEH